EYPDDRPVGFSAHGVPKAVPAQAKARELFFRDATCPLVSKGCSEAERHHAAGRDFVLIGHGCHPEVICTMDQLPEGCLTMIERALKARFPSLPDPHKEDICYATTNRLEAVKRLAEASDLVLVVGSPNSSNSVRLVEVALRAGARDARLVEDAGHVDWRWFDGVRSLGVTAGASAPESLIEGLVAAVADRFDAEIIEDGGPRETVTFKL